VILDTTLALYIYCRHEPDTAELITLTERYILLLIKLINGTVTSLYGEMIYFNLYFIKYLLYWKMFHIKVVDLRPLSYTMH